MQPTLWCQQGRTWWDCGDARSGGGYSGPAGQGGGMFNFAQLSLVVYHLLCLLYTNYHTTLTIIGGQKTCPVHSQWWSVMCSEPRAVFIVSGDKAKLNNMNWAWLGFFWRTYPLSHLPAIEPTYRQMGQLSCKNHWPHAQRDFPHTLV